MAQFELMDRIEQADPSEQLGIKLAVWSAMVPGDWNAVALEGKWTVVYSDHWGECGTVKRVVVNPTWALLFQVSDELIRLSGDDHHIFVESLAVDTDEGTITLWTGS